MCWWFIDSKFLRNSNAVSVSHTELRKNVTYLAILISNIYWEVFCLKWIILFYKIINEIILNMRVCGGCFFCKTGSAGKPRSCTEKVHYSAGQSHRPQPIPAFWMFVMSPRLLETHRPVPRGAWDHRQVGNVLKILIRFPVDRKPVNGKPMCVFIHRLAFRPRTTSASWRESSSTPSPAIIPTLTRCRGTPCAFRSPGTRTQRPWPSGPRDGQAFPG